MKRFTALYAIALLTFGACVKEQGPTDSTPVEVDPVDLSFTIESAAHPLADGSNIWADDDKIAIFDTKSNNIFSLTDGGGTSKGVFSGKAVESASYLALYPYSESATYSEGSIVTVLKKEQTACIGGFDMNLFPTIGATSGEEMKMQNIAGLLEFNFINVPEDKTIEKVVFTSMNAMTGKLAASVDEEGVKVEVVSGNRDAIVNGKFESDKKYYAIVLPANYTMFINRVVFSDGSYFEEYRENVKVESGKVTSLEIKAAGSEQPTTKMFTATLPDYALGNSSWDEDAAISIYDGVANNRFDIAEDKSCFVGKALNAETFYAFAPYSEDLTWEENRVAAKLSPEQKAVEGGYEHSNRALVGKTSDSGIQFHDLYALVSMEISNIPDGKTISEVRLSADEAMAGSYMADTDKGTLAVTGGTKSVVLNGKFDSGKKYYAWVFPGNYSKVKYRLSFDDGSVFENEMDNFSAEVGKMTSLELNAKVASLYERYTAGETITIGGHDYNKETYGEAMLVSENYELTSYNKTSPVYFVESGATLAINCSTVYNLIIIGNDMGKRSQVAVAKQIAHMSETSGTSILFYNADIDLSGITNNLFTKNNAGVQEYLGLINCKLDLISRKNIGVIINRGSATDRDYGTVAIEDCEISIPEESGTNFTVLFSFTSSITDPTPDINNLIIRNNVFYSSETTGNPCFKITHNFPVLGSLVFEHNTMVNLYWGKSGSQTLINYGRLNSVSAHNNLFYNLVNVTNNFFILNSEATNDAASNPNASDISIENNWMNRGSASGTRYDRWFKANLFGSTYNLMNNEGIDPFELKDYTNGIFTVKAEYADYGAQR